MKYGTAVVVLMAIVSESGFGQSPSGYSGPVQIEYQPIAWDYRFDAQYQSTVKPYLRWYMRYDPKRPGHRFLPRDYGPQYLPEHIRYSRIRYWDHLIYLESEYGHTPIVRSRGFVPGRVPHYRLDPETKDELLDPATYDDDPLTSTERKPVWIARDASTGSISVLYQEPPAGTAHLFSKADAVIGINNRIRSLTWESRPAWLSDVQLVDGEFQKRL